MTHVEGPSCSDRRRIISTIGDSCALLVVALGLVGIVTMAQADGGEALFRAHCAPCHGSTGRGDGPAAAALSPRPSDLTKSTLSVSELMKVIDGRRTVRAHGDAAMPVWGRVFEKTLEGSGREHRDTLQTVLILAEYVRTLQPGAAPKAD